MQLLRLMKEQTSPGAHVSRDLIWNDWRPALSLWPLSQCPNARPPRLEMPPKATQSLHGEPARPVYLTGLAPPTLHRTKRLENRTAGGRPCAFRNGQGAGQPELPLHLRPNGKTFKRTSPSP